MKTIRDFKKIGIAILICAAVYLIGNVAFAASTPDLNFIRDPKLSERLLPGLSIMYSDPIIRNGETAGCSLVFAVFFIDYNVTDGKVMVADGSLWINKKNPTATFLKLRVRNIKKFGTMGSVSTLLTIERGKEWDLGYINLWRKSDVSSRNQSS